jgi:hypothetical protein
LTPDRFTSLLQSKKGKLDGAPRLVSKDVKLSAAKPI